MSIPRHSDNKISKDKRDYNTRFVMKFCSGKNLIYKLYL